MYGKYSGFLNGPFTIRVPFFLPFGFNKGTLGQKGQRVLLSGLVLRYLGLGYVVL